MKICPDCLCEYRPHVENCADCGTALLWIEEHEKRQAARRELMERALEEAVAIREGDVPWMAELLDVLIDAGIPARMYSDRGCKKGCRGGSCKLLVSRGDAERAHVRIEDYFAEVNPEARASHERMSEGKCPACGSEVEPNAPECPDCGLALLVIE